MYFESGERVLDDALRDQLCSDVLDDVDRDREGAAVRSPNPGGQADHLAARVHERPARAAAVECGIRLDHVIDRRAVRGRVPALQRTDDARRDRAALTERIPDGDDCVAHSDVVGVAESKRHEGARAHLDLEDREVGGGVDTDDARGQALVAREAHLDTLNALDDAEVGDDVAGLVDHEAGAERLPPGGHLHDPRCRAHVDVVHGQGSAGSSEGRRVRQRRLVDDLPDGRRRSSERARRGHDSDRHGGARRACADERRALKCQQPHARNAAVGRRLARLRLR